MIDYTTMEYEQKLREEGIYTELEIQEKMEEISLDNEHLLSEITKKLEKYHDACRFPAKAEVWEDLFDQCINPNDESKWVGGGHQSGSDTIHSKTGDGVQNKSGVIMNGKTRLESMEVKDLKLIAKGYEIATNKIKKGELILKLKEHGENDDYVKKENVSFTSHRTSTYETLDDKINFISKKHCDKYVLLSRKKNDWEKGTRPYIYYLMIFDASQIDLSKDSLEWNKKGNIYEGEKENKPYYAWINGSKTSDQLNIRIDIDYIGGYHQIIIP